MSVDIFGRVPGDSGYGSSDAPSGWNLDNTYGDGYSASRPNSQPGVGGVPTGGFGQVTSPPVPVNPSYAAPSGQNLSPGAMASLGGNPASNPVSAIGGAPPPMPAAPAPLTATASSYPGTPVVDQATLDANAAKRKAAGEAAMAAPPPAPGALTGGFDVQAALNNTRPYVEASWNANGTAPTNGVVPPPGTDNPYGANIYGPTGKMSYPEYLNWQANTFNSNQSAAQAAYNTQLQQMPYNTQVNQANPYTPYVNAPATAGAPSPATQNAADTAAWQASGLNTTLANPGTGMGTLPGSPAASTGYGTNQLSGLLNALQLFGVNGNRFGNNFSPLLSGAGGTQGNITQTGNSSGGGTDIMSLLPLLLALARQQPQNGTFGNLGPASTY